jgi:hypothetical protein
MASKPQSSAPISSDMSTSNSNKDARSNSFLSRINRKNITDVAEADEIKPQKSYQYQLKHDSETGGTFIGKVETLYEAIEQMYEEAETKEWAFHQRLPLTLRVNYSFGLSNEEFERMDGWNWGRATARSVGGRSRSMSPRGSWKCYD